ncbi:hypothetical protein DF3PB_990005 [uncultured Defluviicoccus sp.]|uniref:Uncharacterized protein n=1 Tax=metagenome TaxID=256318 RepID=A0A380TML2_9ZZZZ|nr:hypothetical protein DF3PB_990005 [uncultured Defluviicoccus sp.]
MSAINLSQRITFLFIRVKSDVIGCEE